MWTFQFSDSAYAHTLLSHARDLYDFAVEYQGDYSDSITNARDFYRWEDSNKQQAG